MLWFLGAPVVDWVRLCQGWAHYGPRAGSSPRGFLVWPAEESLIFDIIDIIDIKELILEVGIIYYLGKFIPYYCRLQECDADWIINCSLIVQFTRISWRHCKPIFSDVDARQRLFILALHACCPSLRLPLAAFVYYVFVSSVCRSRRVRRRVRQSIKLLEWRRCFNVQRNHKFIQGVRPLQLRDIL